jgi:hypothetical protein
VFWHLPGVGPQGVNHLHLLSLVRFILGENERGELAIRVAFAKPFPESNPLLPTLLAGFLHRVRRGFRSPLWLGQNFVQGRFEAQVVRDFRHNPLQSFERC